MVKIFSGHPYPHKHVENTVVCETPDGTKTYIDVDALCEDIDAMRQGAVRQQLVGDGSLYWISGYEACAGAVQQWIRNKKPDADPGKIAERM